MSEDAEILLPELADGRYRLTETNPPDGYVIEKKDVFFSLNDGELELTNEAGDGDNTNGFVSLSGDQAEGYFLTVKNNPGEELPATGGSTTIPIYILGLVLIGFGAIMMIWSNIENE